MMTLDSLLMGPIALLSTLPHNSPEREWVLALAAFALFDLSVITPLFGDHTTSFMLNKEALEVGFFPIQIPHTITTAPFSSRIIFTRRES